MSSTQSEMEAWSSAQLKAKVEEATPDQLRTIREAGLLPEKVAGRLAQVENDYDPEFRDQDDPSRAEHTEKYQEIVRKVMSQVISKAVHNGHDRVINRFIGVVESETSIDNIQSMIRFQNWTTREASVTYLTGHMGYGKTDFGLLMAEVWEKVLSYSDKDIHVATNIKSTAEEHDWIDYIDNQPDLMDWLKNNNGYKFFLFDEASSEASGYSSDADKVTSQMRSMVRMIRKYDGNICLIGHDGKDLHPTVRELADYVEKEGKKEAAVFEGVNEREGEDKMFDITEIPKTNLYYNTKEASSWTWASDAEDSSSRKKTMAEIYLDDEHDISQTQIAEWFDESQSQVSKAVRKFKDELEA